MKDCPLMSIISDKNVGTTFAGVEIVHFCANEAHRDFWYQTGIHQKLGTVVFWQFIVPKILDLMDRVSSSLFLKTSWKHPC